MAANDQPQKVVVELDLAGLYISGETTFADLVVDRAAMVLLGRSTDVAQHMVAIGRRITEQELRDAIRPAILLAIEDSFQPTDTYGSPRGPKITLREAIVAEVQKQTGKRGHGSATRTVLEEVVQVEVGRLLREELQKEVAKAKADVLQAVRDNAAAVITETIRRTASV